jgi:hypothetical protein
MDPPSLCLKVRSSVDAIVNFMERLFLSSRSYVYRGFETCYVSSHCVNIAISTCNDVSFALVAGVFISNPMAVGVMSELENDSGYFDDDLQSSDLKIVCRRQCAIN